MILFTLENLSLSLVRICWNRQISLQVKLIEVKRIFLRHKTIDGDPYQL